jgi:hypothetical protein
MDKDKWLNERIMVDEWGRLPGLADVPLMPMQRKDAFKKQGFDDRAIFFMYIAVLLGKARDSIDYASSEVYSANQEIPDTENNSSGKAYISQAESYLDEGTDLLSMLHTGVGINLTKEQKKHVQ